MVGRDDRELLLYLRDMRWRDVDVRPSAAAPVRADVAVGVPTRGWNSLDEVAAVASTCQGCRLAAARRHVVFGVGDPNARLMLIGEAPGADEDARGEPFVGRAGQVLTAMLGAMRLRRQDVYIANIVKCRPPGNRDPEPDEAAACMPYLRRQIELISPEAIVLLGKVAARFLLGTNASISTLRGSWKQWEGREVLMTFHPAYLLRNLAAKAQVWSDLKQLRRFWGPG